MNRNLINLPMLSMIEQRKCYKWNVSWHHRHHFWISQVAAHDLGDYHILLCLPYHVNFLECFKFLPIRLGWILNNWLCRSSIDRAVAHSHFSNSINSQFFSEVWVLHSCLYLHLRHFVDDCLVVIRAVELLSVHHVCFSLGSCLRQITMRLVNLMHTHRLWNHNLFGFVLTLRWLSAYFVFLNDFLFCWHFSLIA